MTLCVVCWYTLWHCAQHLAISCHFASSFLHLKLKVRAKGKTLLVQYLDGLDIEKTKKKTEKKTLNIYEFLLYTAYLDVSSLVYMRPHTIQRILLTLMFWFSYFKNIFLNSLGFVIFIYLGEGVVRMVSFFFFFYTEVKAGRDVVYRIFKPCVLSCLLSVSLPHFGFYLCSAVLELFFLFCFHDTWAKLAPFSVRPAG